MAGSLDGDDLPTRTLGSQIVGRHLLLALAAAADRADAGTVQAWLVVSSDRISPISPQVGAGGRRCKAAAGILRMRSSGGGSRIVIDHHAICALVVVNVLTKRRPITAGCCWQLDFNWHDAKIACKSDQFRRRHASDNEMFGLETDGLSPAATARQSFLPRNIDYMGRQVVG
jgi:hypothetical protein